MVKSKALAVPAAHHHSGCFAVSWYPCQCIAACIKHLASQHKDYVLVPQLTKYVNKKYVRQPFAPINIPSSASLANMVAST